MKKIISLIFLFNITLFGYEYDKLLLQAQTSVFPKLILLDKDISKKVKDNTIVLTIVHHQSDYYKALEVKQMIEDKFHKLLSPYKFNTILKEFDEITSIDNSNAYYILQGDSSKVKQISNISKINKVVTFAYEMRYFKDDVLFSLAIHNKTQIYLNKKIYQDYNIYFATTLYQIIRFYK